MSSKYRFHVVALPHTRTSKEFSSCAYTQKVLKFCAMMRSLGHAVFHYGAEGSEADCDDHADIIKAEEQDLFFGEVDWRQRTYPIQWKEDLPYWRLANKRAAVEINRRKRRGDFVCLVGGVCQKWIADALGAADVITCEPFVGYTGIFSRFRAFESYTWQSAVYGMMSADPDGCFYDAVIPNYFDPADFPLGSDRQDYMLFMARLIRRKGLQVALDLSEATGRRLVLAGQGAAEVGPDRIVTEEGQPIALSERVLYFGSADPAERARLMGSAHCLVLPTIYMEPFGGVVVEAQMCGTPVVTSDHAAFSETVRHGVTGWRCHTLDQFIWGVENVHRLESHRVIRELATGNYSTKRVRWMYQEWFDMLFGLWGEGWPARNPARADLDWLQKSEVSCSSQLSYPVTA